MSGKSWVDRVPDNWKLVRVSKAYRFSRGLDIKKQDLSDHGLPVISYGQIHAKDNPGVGISDQHIRYIPKELVKEAQLGRARLEEGDIVFADTSEDIEGAGNMVRAAGGSTLYAGYHALIARPSSGFSHKYMAYQMISPSWRQQIQRSVQGVKVYSITQRIFNEVTILQPPRHEQQAIARFLDLKTAEIDALVGKLTRQVELLERYRRELIACIVTRGLNPDMPMRDSGIPWLPRIPSHWEVLAGKHIFTKLQRQVEAGAETVTCFRDGTVTLRRNRRTEGFTESLQEIGYQGVEVGDLVIHEMDAFAGAIGVSNSAGKSTPVYSVCGVQNGGSPEFYAYLLRHMARSGYIETVARGIRQRSVDFRFRTLASLSIAFPPVAEQRNIADFLDKKSKEISSAISGINKQIELLGKYRKQVINDAVTGKVRVEEVA